MFDHSYAELKISHPGVVQLIERAVWDREAESLSLSTRTNFKPSSDISVGGLFALFTNPEISYHFWRYYFLEL